MKTDNQERTLVPVYVLNSIINYEGSTIEGITLNLQEAIDFEKSESKYDGNQFEEFSLDLTSLKEQWEKEAIEQYELEMWRLSDEK